MRKTVGGQSAPSPLVHSWIDPLAISEVFVTSEDASHPIEAALAGTGEGWCAGTPGPQRVRLGFAPPIATSSLRLVFGEVQHARTQEFTLRWSSTDGSSHELVRQQFTFGPPGTVLETETYQATLAGVESLELTIVPDISDPGAVASLREWRIGAGAADVLPGPDESGDAAAEKRFAAWRADGVVQDRAAERLLVKMGAFLAVVLALASAVWLR